MRSSDQHNYVGMTSEPKHDRINNPNTNEQEQIDPIKTQIQKAGRSIGNSLTGLVDHSIKW